MVWHLSVNIILNPVKVARAKTEANEEIWLPNLPLLKSTKKLFSLAKASSDVRVLHSAE